MTFSALSKSGYVSNLKSSSRQGAAIDAMIAHGAAATRKEAVLATTRQVSANYVIDVDGTLWQMVDEDLRAWTSGSLHDGGRGAAWDRRAITFEAINSGGAAQGWPFSPATMEAAAQLLADASRRHGFSIEDNRTPGHRELWTKWGASYPTACPQTFDLGWWRARAREIRGLGAPIQPIVVAPHVPGTAAATHNGYRVTAIQELLTKAGFRTKVDGIFGPNTRAQVKAFQRSVKIVDDGIVGPVTWSRLNGVKAPAAGKIVVDGVWGANTTRGLQQLLGLKPTGVLDAKTRAALQARLGGIVVDGVWGIQTRRRLQAVLGVHVDGIWGPQTIRALQTTINAGKL